MAAHSRIGRRPPAQQGFSYMVALFALVVLGVLTTRALENLQTRERRDREDELMFVGQAYLAAITQYYEQSPGTLKLYPPDLEALTLDARAVRLRRPLRRLYLDPIDASRKWGVVLAPGGGIMGVFSLSQRTPIKTGGFPERFASFASAKNYQDWKFVHEPR